MDSIVYGFDSVDEINENILEPDALNPEDYELKKNYKLFSKQMNFKGEF